MASKSMPSDLYTEVVQVFQGGEPDDDGLPLAGRVSPLALVSFNTGVCACTCAPLPFSLWEFLDKLNPYDPKSEIWLRILPEDCDLPIPEGATLIATRRVSLAVE